MANDIDERQRRNDQQQFDRKSRDAV